MTTTISSEAASPRKKRRVGRIIAIILYILIIPLVIGYFVATSTTFLKKVVLPRVGESMNSTITVSDATISPFSQVIFKNFEVKPVGKETLFKADEIRARYSLGDILRGQITIDEATVISPVVTIVEAADGSSNLDPITKEKNPTVKTKEEKNGGKKSEKPTNLNIRNISLKNAFFQQTKNLKDGGREVTEISNLNLSIDRLSNGQPGKFSIAADVRMNNSPSANTTNITAGSLIGKLVGEIDYKLTPDVQPESAKGNLRFDVSEASGEMADLAKLAAIIDCDLTPSDIRQLSLHFEQAGQPLGEVRASGPFSFANMEGKLKLELSSIDRRVLNLAGTSKGIDFNSTLINATSDLVLAQKGNSISVNGRLNASHVSLTKKETKQTTPTLDLQMTYQLSVDQNAKSALIQSLDFSGTQNQQKILSASISKPMPISWGGANSAPENAALKLVITDLNLDDWKSFATDVGPSGKLNMMLDVVSQQAGKQLSIDLTSRIDALSAKFGSNQISNADVEFHSKANIADMKTFTISEYGAQLAQNKQTALTLNGSGTVDLKSNDADLKTSLSGSLAQLFQIVAVPDLNATSGTLKFDGQISQRKEARTVKGNFALADFSGNYAGSPLDRFGAMFDADLEMNQQDLQIHKLAGALKQAGKSGGNFDVNGNYSSAKKNGNITMKIADVNENALRPFLAKTLGEKQLVSISINGNTSAQMQGEGAANFKGNLDLKNLVVRDPKKTENDAPLAAQFQFDGAMQKEVFDLKQFQVTLSPTQRAKNQLNITGQLDLSKTNALKGNLAVQSDSFDVTPFYDLYASTNKPAASKTKTETSEAPAETSNANEEPEAKHFPVEQIVAQINIGNFYLREIEMKNWHGTAKVEGSHVVLNPFELSLNTGAVKVNADVNLGVKGYAYDFSVSLDGVPLEPLANSFMPDKKGAYQGTIFANAKIKGAGTTGVNLKKTLNGDASLNFTNANIKIVGPKFKKILVPISTALQIPEIAETPINWIDAKLNIADGKINLQNFAAVSASYRGTVQGVIPIADVLTNSPLNKIPVGFELRKSLADKAQKFGLANGAVSADGQYVKLPNLIMLSGTLGDPKSEFDKKGLATLAVQAGAGFIGGDTGKVLKGLGGVLGGKPETNQSNATNSVATPKTNTVDQLLNKGFDFFNKKKKK